MKKAKDADYVVMFGGLNKSDYQDCEGHDRKQYELPYAQNKLIEALAKANKNFIYVNISGNAVAMPWKAQVPAIVQGWFIGSESGEALASILSGDANPSGKMPFTWYESLKQVGAHALDTYPAHGARKVATRPRATSSTRNTKRVSTWGIAGSTSSNRSLPSALVMD